MKILFASLFSFLLIAFIFSFTDKPKERYFMIGYASNNVSGAIWITKKDGIFPDYKQSVDEIKKYQHIDAKVAITSLYEFRNKEEYDKFVSTYESSK